MSLEIGIEDGFNFAMGEWLAEFTRLIIGGTAFLVVGAVIYGGACLYEWWYDRRMKK